MHSLRASNLHLFSEFIKNYGFFENDQFDVLSLHTYYIAMSQFTTCVQLILHNTYIPYIYLFLSNHNVHKSSLGLCFWAPDTLINRFYLNLSIKGSGAQKPRPPQELF